MKQLRLTILANNEQEVTSPSFQVVLLMSDYFIIHSSVSCAMDMTNVAFCTIAVANVITPAQSMALRNCQEHSVR